VPRHQHQRQDQNQEEIQSKIIRMVKAQRCARVGKLLLVAELIALGLAMFNSVILWLALIAKHLLDGRGNVLAVNPQLTQYAVLVRRIQILIQIQILTQVVVIKKIFMNVRRWMR